VRRSIFIGDVHGCASELQKLLDRLALREDDQIFFVGDLLSRGPDSRAVLRLFGQLRARSCIGNHEQRLLAAHEARARGEAGPRMSGSHQQLLAELSDEEWSLLASLPLHIDVPEHGVRVVHAGVMPGVRFEEQEPWLLTHIRSVSADGKPSDRWGTPWGALYHGPPHIVFGHNARKNPQFHEYATGLDTGCVYGGALTAMVLDAEQHPPTIAERGDVLVSVPAACAYSDYGRPLSD
jgi:hypothetical protein